MCIRDRYNGLREQVKERCKRGCLDKEQMDFLKACDITLDAMETWHKRYMDLLEDLINGSEGEQKAHYLSLIHISALSIFLFSRGYKPY